MELASEEQDFVLVMSCDQDLAIREGDHLRLWNSLGMGIAHEVWIGSGFVVYENAGIGGCVRTNTIAAVLQGRKAIEIVARTAPRDLDRKEAFAKSKLGTLWDGFYTCQDFASEVATGKAESFQRDGLLFLAAMAGGVALYAKYQQSQQRLVRRRRY